MAYSVLYDPCIPVQMLDGSVQMLGMRDTFLQAHNIRDIQGETPLERYAVMRLLIAFTMDLMHPEDSYERQSILESGRFDQRQLDDYIEACETQGPRFDLFDPVHPFLQSRYDAKLDAKAEKPVSVIIHALPSGNNHTFIDHRRGDQHEVSCAKAFQALLASYVFCVSGTAGPSSINNTPPLYAIMLGKNLFETIVMNMLSQSEAMPLPYGTGMVPWKMERTIVPRENIADVTLLEGLTWMPRRITLIQNDNGMVQKVYCQAGLDFKGNDLWTDPHVPRIKRKDGTYTTIKPDQGRELWRDAGTLLYDHDGKSVRQPNAFRCIGNVYDEDDFPDYIAVRAAGLITNQAAYTGWTEGELSLPSKLLFEQRKADAFRADAALVESIQYQISINVQRCVDLPRKGSPGKEHEISTQCQLFFLHGAHDILFGMGIEEICSEIPLTEHAAHFCDSIIDLIRRTISQVLYASGSSTEAMIKQMEAEQNIWSICHKIIKERKEKDA